LLRGCEWRLAFESRSTISTSLTRRLLDLAHVGFEPIEASLPNRALPDQPTFGVCHGSWFQPAGTNTPTLLRHDKAAGLEHSDVFHEARQRHVEWSSELSNGGFALAQSRKNRSPGRVRKRAKYIVELRR